MSESVPQPTVAVVVVRAAFGPGTSTRATRVARPTAAAQTAYAVVVLPNPPVAVDATAVHEAALAAPSGSMFPAASLGYIPTGLSPGDPGGVACAPPPTTTVPGGHVTVTRPTVPDGIGAFT